MTKSGSSFFGLNASRGFVVLIYLIGIIGLSACNDDAREIETPIVEETPTPEPTPEPAPAPEPAPPPPDPANLSSCTSSPVDAGAKASNTNVNRGNLSDVELIPGTSSIAMAYHDQGSLSLKLSYWNGTTYIKEVIAGEGGTASVNSLTMTIPATTSKPIVVWTSGTRVKVAIRDTALPTQSANWNVWVLENVGGSAPRAVEASSNPLGQVLVSYLTNTANTGRAKVYICDAPCTSGLGFQLMTPNAFLENTNITAAQVRVGAGWCKVSNSL